MRACVWTKNGRRVLYILAFRDGEFTGEYLGDETNFDPSNKSLSDQILIVPGFSNPATYSNVNKMFEQYEKMTDVVDSWAIENEYDQSEESHRMAFKLRWT